MRRKNLSIEFCGVKCENPFFLASSPVGNNYDMCAKALETGWGGIVFKTVAMERMIEVSPRFHANKKEGTPFIGFKNMEQVAEHSLEENLADMKKLKENYPNKVLIASIMGSNEEEWTKLAQLVTEVGADIIECNFSCPQMTSHAMGSDVGQNPELVKKYSAAVRRGTNLPVLAKMTPNIGRMEVPAVAAVEGGATGVSAINTIKCITAVDLDKKVALPIINGKSAISGYSGKAVKPIALRFVSQLAKEPKLKNVPISGIGGIETWEDAIEFIMLGASNLQVTTAIMQYGYRIVEDLISGIEYYMEEKGVEKLSDLVGVALDNVVPAENLDRDYIVYPNFDTDKCIGCGRCYVSCYDGAHQAIVWDEENRRPSVNKDNCVGCHLCALVCPIEGCITKGEIKFKDFGVKREISL
ncbi:NAD-dependent dihydropyrimidine dehydrogenase subunit PreA [Clostridium sp. P21]|uniref:Dihydroorotate dehydrogenase B (NAD(+)), catalytic subunit n=1 Tax=Clostridium muellerianum TaxID=2716538 RepID=A0A7Y0EK48_9CLOT|nr:NAD-dependent dihydropyrimidine dehydrogenase subunit PreA [Clostridium muellerianum]NMM64867.1 NAD-dependent dihydropyrimidine dehydrogenase subunit PreA [Clostridium muellerianum]